MKKAIRKAEVFLFSAMMVFLSMPIGYLTGGIEAADAATKSFSGKLSQSNTGYTLKSARYMEIWVPDFDKDTDLEDLKLRKGSGTDGGMALHKFSVGGFLTYCVEHAVTQKGDSTLKSKERDDSQVARSYEGSGKGYFIDNVKWTLYLSPAEGSTISELKNIGYEGSGTLNDWIAASQLLIWECQQGFRSKSYERQANGLSYQSSWRGALTTKISEDHYYNNIRGTNAGDIYNFMVKKIQGYLKASKSDEKAFSKLSVPSNATFPYEIKMNAPTGSKPVKVYEKGTDNESSDVKIRLNDGIYTITVQNKEATKKSYDIRFNDDITKRVLEYRAKSEKYSLLFWEHALPEGHTQSFVSGFDDPPTFELNFTESLKSTPSGSCDIPNVEVFPEIKIPITKVDANGGFDDDVRTPMGDAYLNANYTLYRQIGSGAWEEINSYQMGNESEEYIFTDTPFYSYTELEPYLTESGSISGCNHFDEDTGEPEHTGTKSPKKRVWDVTVKYRVVETRPQGRYINPDKYNGEREYSFTYHAESHDTCSYYCDNLPWTDIEYKFTYGATKGDGGNHTSGATTTPEETLTYDLETFVNDCMRGDILIIKSNEKDDAFKDSPLGGTEGNISNNSKWTMELENESPENERLLHLKSFTPEVLPDGTYQYTVSRNSGEGAISEEKPLSVGTNGEVLIKDVPFGRYIVKEVKADDPMFVLEEFSVVIDEHRSGEAAVPEKGSFTGYSKTGTSGRGSVSSGTGDFFNDRFDVNLRDKVKKNVIKVIKTDAETGKTERLKRTKVYIRYKGYPGFSEEENIEKYGPSGTVTKNIYERFIPNAEAINSKSDNYTFELSENGEIVIPYELPYGTYEISEWLLPEGYFVGEYNEDGKAKSHDYGKITENEMTAKDGSKYEDIVSIYDSDGNRVEYMDKSAYSFDELKNMVVNTYSFDVTEQENHVTANFSQRVDYMGVRTEADPAYDASEHTYTKYYRAVAIANNGAKGKIRITAKGDVLTGFIKKKTKEGYEILEPVFEKAKKLKDVVFGIFAAEDIKRSDGTEGPSIFNKRTGEEIKMSLDKRTNLSSEKETVTAFSDKLIIPKEYPLEDNYEILRYKDESGAELFSLLERNASEGNIKRTLYITPEQNDTAYKYSFKTEDDVYIYTYEILLTLQSQAGGRNVTGFNLTKTTEVKEGYVPKIPLSGMRGFVGDKEFDPLENYIAPNTVDETGTPIYDATSPIISSILDVYEKEYHYEADGGEDIYGDGVEGKDGIYTFDDEKDVDLSMYCPERYKIKDYEYYNLSGNDVLPTEEPGSETFDILKTIKNTPSGSTDIIKLDGVKYYVVYNDGETAALMRKNIDSDYSKKFGTTNIYNESNIKTYLESTYLNEHPEAKEIAKPITFETAKTTNENEFIKTENAVFWIASEADMFGTIGKTGSADERSYTFGEKFTAPGGTWKTNEEHYLLRSPFGSEKSACVKNGSLCVGTVCDSTTSSWHYIRPCFAVDLTGIETDDPKEELPDGMDTEFEKDNGVILLSNEEGERAITNDGYVYVSGYYEGGKFISFEKLQKMPCDETGNVYPEINLPVPEGYDIVEFTGDVKKESHYFIIKKDDEEKYKVLTKFSDIADSAEYEWIDCDKNGNFEKAVVQVFNVKYIEEPEDKNGFKLFFDDFSLDSGVDENFTAKAILNVPEDPENGEISLGAGYKSPLFDGNEVTFRTSDVKAPIYFEWENGINVDMYYRGGISYTTVTVPMDAIDYLYSDIVPTLKFIHDDGSETVLDWYEKLSPSNVRSEFSVLNGLPDGTTVVSERHDVPMSGEDTYYTIKIASVSEEDTPLELAFSDGYRMRIYNADTISGNKVGVLDLYSTYKTTDYTKSDLIETVRTDETGVAESSLLPLGKYIVRELTAPSGYVTNDNEFEVELRYKDQFTPLVWGEVAADNCLAETEIEFNKAFELLNGNYQKSSGALFGIFSADYIEADMTGMKATEKASTGPDTLIGIISPKNGEGLLKTRLPIGHKYYLKELETGEKYLLNESKYFFYVSDDVSGEHFNFKYDTDGIYGYAYREGSGDITLKVSIESRYPVPVIIIDGRGYRLDENIPKGEETNGEVCFNADNVAIRENGDRTDIKILVKKEKPRDILLPNGKKLIIKADEEEAAAYTVILDGTLSTFSPVSRTYGSNLKFRHEYVPSEKAKDDLSADIEFVSLETAGYVTKNTVDIKITHKPKTKLENTDSWIDENDHSQGHIQKEVLNADKNGKRQYVHTANISVEGTDYEIKENEKVIIDDSKGNNIYVFMSGHGNLTVQSTNYISEDTFSETEEIYKPKLMINGEDKTSKLIFALNREYVRSVHSEDTIRIKINEADMNKLIPIQNDRIEEDEDINISAPDEIQDRPDIVEEKIKENSEKVKPVKNIRTEDEVIEKETSDFGFPKTGDRSHIFADILLLILTLFYFICQRSKEDEIDKQQRENV